MTRILFIIFFQRHNNLAVSSDSYFNLTLAMNPEKEQLIGMHNQSFPALSPILECTVQFVRSCFSLLFVAEVRRLLGLIYWEASCDNWSPVSANTDQIRVTNGVFLFYAENTHPFRTDFLFDTHLMDQLQLSYYEYSADYLCFDSYNKY